MRNKFTHLSEAAQAERRKKKKREGKEKMCDNKTPYPTHELAIQPGQRSYKCDYFGLWHRSGQQAEFIASLIKQKPKPAIAKGSKKKKKPAKKKGLNGKSLKLRGKIVRIRKLN